jgi:hypothetical protein
VADKMPTKRFFQSPLFQSTSPHVSGTLKNEMIAGQKKLSRDGEK